MQPRFRSSRSYLPLLLAGLSMASTYATGAQQTAAGDLFAHQGKQTATAGESATSSRVELQRMLLLMQPEPSKRAALEKLLIAQQTPGDAQFHHWLTSAQFAERFSPGTQAATAVTSWLRSQGFAVAPLPQSRGWIEFSGTLAQVQTAFHTPVKVVPGSSESDGSLRYKITREPSFPADIARFVRGLVSLDGSRSAPAALEPVEFVGGAADSALPQGSQESGQQASQQAINERLAGSGAMTPRLVRSLMELGPVSSHAANGAGEWIAIPARSNVRLEDFSEFRKKFSLPIATLQVELNGNDPGRTGDEASAILAASWAGVAAPEAQIVLVAAESTTATDGLDLALAYTIDHSLARTVSVGYTSCERAISSSHQEFYAALYRQAAAEGIAVIAATGDSGAAACHSAASSAPVTTGLAVNALASTPWNTAVGVVSSAANGTFIAWQAGQPASQAAGLHYASGGGTSAVYETPWWQSASGLPTAEMDFQSGHHRSLPDVSLPTASAGPGLAFCYSGQNAVSGCRLVFSSGSAASAALFAGVAARLAQQYGPQGNLAPNLYALQRSDQTGQRKAFTDVTAGSAQIGCRLGSPDCSPRGQIGFSAHEGYDLVSGLGSVNAQSLMDRWASPQDVGTATDSVEMTNINGQTYNPSATVVLSARVLSGSGGSIPTGTVQFYDQTTNGNTGTPVTVTTTGTASYSEIGQFTSGGHNIVAEYSGDKLYQAAISQPVTINIQPSSTLSTVTPSTATPAGGSTITVTGAVTSANPGNSPPTGTFTVNLDGISQGFGTLASIGGKTTASLPVTVPASGSHTLQGVYSGDLNYNSSTSTAVAIAVVKTGTVTTLAATPSIISTGIPETLTATIMPAGSAIGTLPITGTVSFYDQNVSFLGSVGVTANTAILSGVNLSTTTTHSVTANYSGDTSYNPSASSPLLLQSNLFPVTVTLVATNAVLGPGQAVELTATVTPVNTPPLTSEQHPSGYILFYANSTLISGQVPIVVGQGFSSVASVFVPHIPAGQYVVTAHYFGDPTYQAAVSNSVNLQVEDFTISSTITNINIVQGNSASVPFTVQSLGGLAGQIQVVCEEQNPSTLGAIQCYFTPTLVDGSGAPNLTIITTAGNVTRNDGPGPGPGPGPGLRPGSGVGPVAGGGIALAFIGLLLTPIGRRARWLRNRAGNWAGRALVVALLLAGMVGAGVGCSNSVTLSTTRGTPLGVHTLKITAAAFVGTVTVSHNAYLTVNVEP